MSYRLTYDKSLNILTAKIVGYPSFEDFQQVMYEITQSSEIPSDVNTLWDISDMEFDSIDLEFGQSLVEMRKKFNTQRGAAKIAIFSNYKLGEPLVKLFLIISKDISQSIRAFTTLEETQSWLME